jgi:hypothetical protein
LIFGLHRFEHVGQFIVSQDAFLNESRAKPSRSTEMKLRLKAMLPQPLLFD